MSVTSFFVYRRPGTSGFYSFVVFINWSLMPSTTWVIQIVLAELKDLFAPWLLSWYFILCTWISTQLSFGILLWTPFKFTVMFHLYSKLSVSITTNSIWYGAVQMHTATQSQHFWLSFLHPPCCKSHMCLYKLMTSSRTTGLDLIIEEPSFSSGTSWTWNF